MINQFIVYAFLAGLGTWLMTALGSSLVLFIKSENKRVLSLIMGLGAGIMIAASFFSLILPSLESLEINKRSFLEAVFGFFFGGIFLFFFDLFLGRVENKKNSEDKSNKLLFLAITLHNIPEGLAIGVAFGLALGNVEGSLLSAFLLALGIGLQNFPEGLAISLPLRNNGMNKWKAFFYGQLSALVEPISALIGVVLVYLVNMILPFVLCFAAGAMIYVVVEELIPSGKISKDDKMCTLGIIFGFVIMMLLDLAF